MSTDSAFPRILRKALDGGEAKIGRIVLWVCVVMIVFLGVLLVVNPPKPDEVGAASGVFAIFGVGAAFSWWLSRKPFRVHRSRIARVLLEQPNRVTKVHEIMIRPHATGQAVVRETVRFDGESEFAPRNGRVTRVLGFMKVEQRSMVFVKIDGMLFARKLVVPSQDAPTLLSWLFSTVAKANPQCRWGERTVADLTG